VKIADGAFKANVHVVTSLKVPYGVIDIGEEAFSMRNMVIELPNSVTSIGYESFYSAYYEIKFNGTVSEWDSISKAEHWNRSVDYDSTVICSDGTVAL
jgi:hypothetical protein